ncbi:MAG: HK97 family phage prohead protease [Acidobacteriota bacterium]|nr:HK97 family phage prohead protease [Acidobacteriota bacterium]
MSERLEHKAIAGGVEVKDADQGIVEAVVARIGVKDLEDDVFLPGSFGERSVRVSAYNHRSWPHMGGEPPVGRGTIREHGDEVIATLKFLMGTTAGRETFETIKEMSDLQEWSFGWAPGGIRLAELTKDQRAEGIRRAIESVDVVEVSPVIKGASIDTRTIGVKCDKCGHVEGGSEEVEEAETPDPAEPEVKSEPDGHREEMALIEGSQLLREAAGRYGH